MSESNTGKVNMILHKGKYPNKINDLKFYSVIRRKYF